MRLEEVDTIITRTPAGYRRIKKRYKRHHLKKRYRVLIGICLFLVVLGVSLPALGYLVLDDTYHRDLSLAQTGEQDLQAAKALMQSIEHDPLNTEVISAASRDLLCKMVEDLTAKGVTDATLHFLSGEQTSWFNNGPFAMHPMRLNAVDKGDSSPATSTE